MIGYVWSVSSILGIFELSTNRNIKEQVSNDEIANNYLFCELIDIILKIGKIVLINCEKKESRKWLNAIDNVIDMKIFIMKGKSMLTKPFMSKSIP